METERKIENTGADTVQAHGWQVLRGYVFRVVAESDDAWKCEAADGEPARYGYHGLDYPPCGADYLLGDGDDLLVISCERDPDAIDTVDGFTLQPHRLDEGTWYSEDDWRFVVLSVKSDGEHVIAGKA